MGKVSKNARESRVAKAKEKLCDRGHKLERVKVVPVFGRARLMWWCECSWRVD